MSEKIYLTPPSSFVVPSNHTHQMVGFPVK